MAQAAPRPTVRGPTFIRLLARLAEADVAAPGASLPDHLGQWLDWKHALSLAAALDSHPAAPADAAMTAPDDLAAECARARDTLLAAIDNEPLLASAAACTNDTDFAPYRQAYLTRQRAIQAAVGRLRGKLRDALLHPSPSASVATNPPSRHSREGGNPSCSSAESNMDDRHPPLNGAPRMRGNDSRDASRDETATARLAEDDPAMDAPRNPGEHSACAMARRSIVQRPARLQSDASPGSDACAGLPTQPAAAVSPQGRHSRESGNPPSSSTETAMDDRVRGNDGSEGSRDRAALARLAEVDAVMEVALTPREHTALAKVPDLLAQRFARLQAGAQPHWLDAFRREMQSVLRAELDLRFQPVAALLAALRTS